jgi:N-acetylmuramoyl-L-alanine amidase
VSIVETPSPNFNERQLPVTMIVLHYTGMESADAALERLTDPAAEVSAHYLVDEDGTVHRMVAEDKRAWHAGKSHWRGITDVNSASIGIELVNPGHDFGYRDFPEAQVDALIPLMAEIKQRHGVTRGNVVGHSDIACTRKRLAMPRPTRNLIDPLWSDAGFLLALERFGYEVTDKLAAVVAFQRRFRPELIDGEIDGECRSLLLALLLPKPLGEE